MIVLHFSDNWLFNKKKKKIAPQTKAAGIRNNCRHSTFYPTYIDSRAQIFSSQK